MNAAVLTPQEAVAFAEQRVEEKQAKYDEASKEAREAWDKYERTHRRNHLLRWKELADAVLVAQTELLQARQAVKKLQAKAEREGLAR